MSRPTIQYSISPIAVGVTCGPEGNSSGNRLVQSIEQPLPRIITEDNGTPLSITSSLERSVSVCKIDAIFRDVFDKLDSENVSLRGLQGAERKQHLLELLQLPLDQEQYTAMQELISEENCIISEDADPDYADALHRLFSLPEDSTIPSRPCNVRMTQEERKSAIAGHIDKQVISDVSMTEDKLIELQHTNKLTVEYYTPLEYACKHGYRVETIQKLINSSSANMNGYNASGRTALMVAVASGHYDIAKTLLKAGAKPDITSGLFGYTALHIAIRSENIFMVLLLLYYGASDVPNNQGMKPSDYAFLFLNHKQRVRLWQNGLPTLSTIEKFCLFFSLFCQSSDSHTHFTINNFLKMLFKTSATFSPSPSDIRQTPLSLLENS